MKSTTRTRVAAAALLSASAVALLWAPAVALVLTGCPDSPPAAPPNDPDWVAR